MDNHSVDLSIIFPCYNEQGSVDLVLSNAIETLDSSSENIEVLVVDDGSTDQSMEKLRKFEGRIQIISHDKNLGYGAALKTGLFYSKGAAICFMDFDGTCSPQEAVVLLHFLRASGVQMVIGNRMHGQSHMPQLRTVGNKFYTFCLKFFGGVQTPSDICSGFRVIERKTAEDLFKDLPNDLSFTPAMTSKALRLKIPMKEHPIHYSERIGDSKISLLKDGPKFLISILRSQLL